MIIKDERCSTEEVLTYHVMVGSNVPSNVTSISSGLKYLASNSSSAVKEGFLLQTFMRINKYNCCYDGCRQKFLSFNNLKR